jgi:hypothetical protein
MRNAIVSVTRNSSDGRLTGKGERMSDQDCYNKGRAKGERTFTLRSQDLTAPKVIGEWIKENIETASPEKLLDALDAALEMRRWPTRKMPD